MQGKNEQQVIGRVVLVVRDLENCLAYYQEQIGLTLLNRDGDAADLGCGDTLLLSLHGDPKAPGSGRGAGLYHFALLLPSRRALALQVQHFGRQKVRLQGMSDHLVSEALYLADPEGNGIEIYADRPRDQWRWNDGEVDMQTLPLDVDDLARELQSDSGEWTGIPPGTTMGHVHLRVSNLDDTGKFYTDIVGLEITTRSYPGALFLSKGRYHHHLGLNTWSSAGAPAAARGAAGLSYFEYWPNTMDEWQTIKLRAAQAGLSVEENGETEFYLADPSGNRILFRSKAI